MKKLFIFFLLVTTLVVSCNTEKTNTINETKVIEELMNQQEISWNEGDLKGFMSTYWKSDSLCFIGKNGVNYGWETTLENYKKSYKNKSEMGVLSFNNISITQLSLKYIYVIGKWHLDRLEPLEDLSGHYTLIWKKIDEKWIIISDHSS